MDGSRFDSFTQTLALHGTRRRALGGLLFGAFGFLSLSADDAAAHDLKAKCKKKSGDAKKKCLKQAKKHAATHTVVSPPPCPQGQRPCRGACLSTLICCDDSDCAGGRTCQNGTCACPDDAPHGDCPGSGSVCQQCCESRNCWINGADQGDGRQCQSGACVCTVLGTRLCPSGLCGFCCDTSECSGGKTCVRNNPGPGPGRCECAYFPSPQVECRGRCVAPCSSSTIRNPETCGCCIPNGAYASNITPCCSGQVDPNFSIYCGGLAAGSTCSFPQQCWSNNCLCGAFGCACQ